MKTLILMRHAKSDWGDPRLPDSARPLNARGRRAATALGVWLRAQNLRPDQILCSSSVRTQETCARLKLDTAPELQDALYLAEADEMLTVLRRATGSLVLMLGHNPGIAEFARLLLASPPNHDRFDDYPTGATLIAQFDITDWSALHPGTGTVLQFLTPHDLP
ncbi:MAG: histidine phosphatase family protein [Roseovarius sp.]|uniref:SixA phosphatase family protein n=1 Tax=Roseovarius sp. TaxID=1486281 RepID=UPI001B55DA2E|nr:histidine phosphatase family protein [Roseovarius sp.]MBQ0749349.1 histidine phosphatase family protein [Roseovarius sp.]MBQ0809898.1 histidine phosphatase family protein [Roseovarius sp.]